MARGYSYYYLGPLLFLSRWFLQCHKSHALMARVYSYYYHGPLLFLFALVLAMPQIPCSHGPGLFLLLSRSLAFSFRVGSCNIVNPMLLWLGLFILENMSPIKCQTAHASCGQKHQSFLLNFQIARNRLDIIQVVE